MSNTSSSDFRLSPVTAAIVVYIHQQRIDLCGAMFEFDIVSVYSLHCHDDLRILTNFSSDETVFYDACNGKH